MYRKVVTAELDEGGQRSIFKEWVTLGCLWTLTLECGHIIYKSPRYIKKTGLTGAKRFRRKSSDALPAPKRVICRECKQRS